MPDAPSSNSYFQKVEFNYQDVTTSIHLPKVYLEGVDLESFADAVRMSTFQALESVNAAPTSIFIRRRVLNLLERVHSEGGMEEYQDYSLLMRSLGLRPISDKDFTKKQGRGYGGVIVGPLDRFKLIRRSGFYPGETVNIRSPKGKSKSTFTILAINEDGLIKIDKAKTTFIEPSALVAVAT